MVLFLFFVLFECYGDPRDLHLPHAFPTRRSSELGFLSLVWLLSGYFGSFDFGIGRATAYVLARPQTSPDCGNSAAQIFWTALTLSAAFGDRKSTRLNSSH